MFDDLTRALTAVDTALARLDPQSMIGAQPATGLELLGRHERAVASARLRLTARAAEMNHWRRQGYRSFEEWYAATFGTSFGQARRKARAARHLAGSDRTADALADGEISEDEADVVADAASGNPDAERELLDTARNRNKGLNDLKDEAARAKAAGEGDRERSDRLRRGRTAGWGLDRDGHWTVNGKFEPEVGAEIKARLAAETDRIFSAARRADRREPLDRYRADALAALILGRHRPPGPAAEGPGRPAGHVQPDLGLTADQQPRNEASTDATLAGPAATGRVGRELVLDVNLEALRRGCVNPGATSAESGRYPSRSPGHGSTTPSSKRSSATEPTS